MRIQLGVLFAVCTILLVVSAVPASAAIEIDRIRYDPAGDDDGTNESLNRESIRIVNTGNRAVRLGGGTVHTSEHLVFYFPRLRVGADTVLTIHTGSGDDTKRHLYWGLTRYAWDNGGDTARLWDGRMNERDACTYMGGGHVATC